MPAISALESGNPDGDDGQDKQARMAARAARFTQKLPGNRYKELEEMRSQERKAFEQQGLIKSGKTELHEAVDMRGTCEAMCSNYEREFREWTREVHPFERIPNQPARIDPGKAVAAYSRSDAGAGHGDSAILPSDLRTPHTLVRTLDYLINEIMGSQPAGTTTISGRKALGYSAGFIRDRTRAIRKEFAMQSSWGHAEAIATYERIARWHILCLRELQEESGTNTDMHIDNAELGRCFTSLRQQYDDRRRQTGLELPCPNEPEFRAYMLIFDLAQKSISIPTAELPSIILDHPLVQLAWEIRRSAQRNFDTQKEGSKHNSELGMNMINRFVKLLKQPKVPYLLSCLVEIRLRDVRRSALRALVRAYPRIKDGQPLRINDAGEVVERRVMQLKTLETILGCEAQEDEESAWDDVVPRSRDPQEEAMAIAERFDLEVCNDAGETVGVLINMGSAFNDNRDAPYTRRWKSITEKRGIASFADVVNGRAGVNIDGAAAPVPRQVAPASKPRQPVFPGGSMPSAAQPSSTTAFSFGSKPKPAEVKPVAGSFSAFGATATNASSGFPFGGTAQASSSKPPTIAATPSSQSAFAPAVSTTSASDSTQDAPAKPAYTFSFGKPAEPAAAKASDSSSTGTIPAAPMFSFGAQEADEPAAVPAVKTPFTFGAASLAAPAEKDTTSAEVSSPPFKEPPTFSFATTKADAPAAGLLSTNAAAGPSQPFFSTPAPAPTPPLAAPVALASSASLPLGASTLSHLSSSISSRPVRRSLSLAKSLTRSQKDTVANDRRKMMTALPPLADELIEQVLQSVLGEIQTDLERIVKQEEASRAYARKKQQRKDQIHGWSSCVLNAMIADEAYEMALSALRDEDARRKAEVRRTQKRLSAAADREEMAHEAERDRQHMLARLSHMGLGGPARSDTPVFVQKHVHHELRDEFEADVRLRGAQRSREAFLAHSTFFRVIADQVAKANVPITPKHAVAFDSTVQDIAPPPGPPDQPVFDIKVSLSRADASLASGQAQTWLKNKFAIPAGAKEFRQDGTTFHVSFDQDQTPQALRDTGLVIFEAPAQTHDLRSVSKDAQERMNHLASLASSASCKYDVALLVVTWAKESLTEALDRLGIRSVAEKFPSVGIFCLDDADELDTHLASTLASLLPKLGQKQRAIVPVDRYVARIGPVWMQLRDNLDTALTSRSSPASLSTSAFDAGIRSVQRLFTTVDSSLPAEQSMSTESTFAAPSLPAFKHGQDDTDADRLASNLVDYLADPFFASMAEVQLVAATLRPTVIAGEPLPIARLLTVIAYALLGGVSAQYIALDMWDTPSRIDQLVSACVERAAETYQAYADMLLSEVLASADEIISDRPPSPQLSGESDRADSDNSLFAGDDPRGEDFEAAWAENMFEFEHSQPVWRPHGAGTGDSAWGSPGRSRQALGSDRRSLKRSRQQHDEDYTPLGDELDGSAFKASKNARLLAAIRAAGSTLSELGTGQWQPHEQVV